MKPTTLTAIIDRKRYSTTTATLLSGDDHWDGNNFERQGRNTFLYRTPNGSYFATHLTRWEGELDRIEPLTIDEATSMYESHEVPRGTFAEAFPGVEVTEA